MGKHYLNKLFEPRSVAVFGASEREGAVGTLVFSNMIQDGFSGEVYPINPKHAEVQGHKAYADLDSLGKSVDLAVITTPASTVPGIIESCGEHGVRAAVILSAGFREVGPQGLNLEQAWGSGDDVSPADVALAQAANFTNPLRIKAWSFTDYLMRRDPALLISLDAIGAELRDQGRRRPLELAERFEAEHDVALDQLDREWADFWTGASPVLQALSDNEPPLAAVRYLR